MPTMIRITRISNAADGGADRTERLYHFVSHQPSWITRLALMAFLIVIALPIVLLLLLAFAAAVVIFAVLTIAKAILNAGRGVLTRSDGRENVRIIRRSEP